MKPTGWIKNIGNDRMRYSAIEHRARNAWASEWEQGLISMFTAAFDASGTQDQALVAVAGFVAPAKEWTNFDLAWRERLSRDGLEYFHMSDFAGNRDAFFRDDWKGNKERRGALIKDLIELIQCHASRKFGCVILNKDFNSRISSPNRSRFDLNSYALSGLACVRATQIWAKQEGMTHYVLPIFEDGDKGKGKLIRRVREYGYPAPEFGFKKDTITRDGLLVPGYTPLQAADILAYEMAHAIRDILNGDEAPPRDTWVMLDRQQGPRQHLALRASAVLDLAVVQWSRRSVEPAR